MKKTVTDSYNFSDRTPQAYVTFCSMLKERGHFDFH